MTEHSVTRVCVTALRDKGVTTLCDRALCDKGQRDEGPCDRELSRISVDQSSEIRAVRQLLVSVCVV